MKTRLKYLFSVFQYDIFNHQFFLRIGRKNKNSTIFSMIISHFLLITMLLYFLFSSFNTFLHTNPQINVQDFDVNTRSYVHLDNQNFHFAFRIEDNNGNAMKIDNISNYFDIDVSFISQIHNESVPWNTTNTRSFEFEPCKSEDFKEFQNYFESNLKHAFCLQNHSFSLGGFWDEIKMDYLYMTINFCDVTNPNCMGRDTFAQAFKGSYLTFYIETQNVDGNDYRSPLRKNLKYYSYLLDTNTKKDLNFYVKEVQLQTNDNLFFNQNPTVERFFKQNQVDLDFNNNFNTQQNNVTLNAFWEIYIYSANQIQIIERTYTTLTAVFASVGGISKFLLIIGTFITLYYNEMKLQSELLNDLFLFDLEGNSPRKARGSAYNRDIEARRFRRTFSSYLDNKKGLSASVGCVASNQINLFDFKKKIDPEENNNSPEKTRKELFSRDLNEARIDSPIIYLNADTDKNPLNPLSKEFTFSKQVSLKNLDQNQQILMFSGDSEHEHEENNDNNVDNVIFNPDGIKSQRRFTRNQTFPAMLELNATKRGLLEKTLSQNQENLKNQDNNVEEIKEEDIPPNNDNDQPIIDEKNLLEMHLNKSLKYLNEAKISTKNKLQFSFWEILRSIFFPFCLSKNHKKKLKLYTKASDDLLKYINIMELVQMLQQVEKLKVIMLNKNQLALFNFLSKPLISLEKPSDPVPNDSETDNSGTKVSRMMRYMQGGNMKEHCKDIISYYNDLLESGNYSEIDKKLFELLDDDFRTVIDRFGTNRDSAYLLKRSKMMT